MYLSTEIPTKLVFDPDTLLVSQHKRPQHQAPHIHQVEQGLIHRVLLHVAMAAIASTERSRQSCQQKDSKPDQTVLMYNVSVSSRTRQNPQKPEPKA